MTVLPPPEESKRQQPAIATTSARLTHLLNYFQPAPETVVLLLAILIGSSAGMGVVTFHYLIQLVHHFMLEDLMGVVGGWGAWTLAGVPMLGGAIVGLMRSVRPWGPGLAALIAAAPGGTASQANPRQLRPVARMIAASVSLGSGASLGPEGPSVEIGANFGLLLSQVLQVSQERQRLLLGAGAAAGLAAGFNAPIAGVFFALEVVLGTTFATSAVSVVLLAAVVAALIAQIGLGGQPAFTLPVYQVRSPLELPLYMGLGLFACAVSLAYTQLLRSATACFQGQVPGCRWLSQIPAAIHPMIGGACVGLVALQLPQILGIGYETIDAMLQDVEFSLPLLIVLLLAKLVMTAVSLGSGLVGGVFAPAMFLGASLGAAYAKVLAVLLPGMSLYLAAPPAYAMVGMAAVLAGSVRAPLTAILLMFELTRDYRIVLPLMAAVGLSVWLVELLKPSTTNRPNLPQSSLAVKPDENQEILQQTLVAEAMRQAPLQLTAAMSVVQAGLVMISSRDRSALVVNEAAQLVGIVTLEDINRALIRRDYKYESDLSVSEVKPLTLDVELDSVSSQPTLLPQPTLGEICTTEILYAYIDEPLSEALDRMAARGLHQLPVVERNCPEQVVGLLEQEQIALTGKLVATRKALHGYLPLSLIEQELVLPAIEQTTY